MHMLARMLLLGTLTVLTLPLLDEAERRAGSSAPFVRAWVHNFTISVHFLYVHTAKLLELTDAHRGMVWEACNNVQLATHCLNKGTQGADIYISASLKSGYCRLLDV